MHNNNYLSQKELALLKAKCCDKIETVMLSYSQIMYPDDFIRAFGISIDTFIFELQSREA